MVTHTICKPHGHRAGQQVQSIFMNEFLRMLDIDQLALGSIHLLLLPQPIRNRYDNRVFNLSKCVANVYLINEMSYCTSICVPAHIYIFVSLYKQADVSAKWMKQHNKSNYSINATRYVGRN